MFLLVLTASIGFVPSNGQWDLTGLNVAINKVTDQLPGTHGTYESQLAVDGNKDSESDRGHCSHTSAALNAPASWSVDLNGSYILEGIRIYNRNMLRERLDNFQILGYPMETTLYDDSIVQIKLARELVISIAVNSTIAFSNITIRIPAHYVWPDGGNSYLALCEVEIYTEIKCKAPKNFPNGMYGWPMNEEYSVGETLTWNCSEGYRSEQNKTRQCLVTSAWTGAEPNCSLIECAYPSILSNVTLTFANGSYYIAGGVPSKSKINVNCNKGFKTNTTIMHCTLDGDWDSMPTCLPITCKWLTETNNGQFTYMYNNATMNIQDSVLPCYGTIAVAHCDDNFTYLGYSRRQCGENGNWSGNDGSCVAVCRIPSLENGTFEGDVINEKFVQVGHHVSPQCYGDLVPVTSDGTHEYECLENHTWRGPDDVKCVIRVGSGSGMSAGSPAAAVGGGIAGCVVLAAVVAVVVMVYLRKRRSRTQETFTHCTLTEIEIPKYENLNIETRVDDTYNNTQLSAETSIESTNNYESLNVQTEDENTHNYEQLGTEPRLEHPPNNELLGTEPRLEHPTNYEQLGVTTTLEDKHDYEQLNIHSNK